MENGKLQKKDILERLFKFSITIIKLASELPRTPAGFAIASQVIRSGTSIGANAEEAQDAISRREFLTKMNISLKEARETRYWLMIIKESKLISGLLIEELISESNEIIAILVVSVRKLKNSL